MTIERIGVVGCGLMGSGIAEVTARAGLDVVVREVDSAAVEAGRGRIERSLEKALARERTTAEANDLARARIRFTTDLADLADAIEALRLLP